MQFSIRLLILFAAYCAFAGAIHRVQAADPAPPARVALVIGNSRYEAAVGPLRNTVNDARAISRTLRTLGFTVIEVHNVTRNEMMAALLKFRTKLRGAEVGLFYFAGHGISVAGANYLLPVRSGYQPAAVSDHSARRLLAETKLLNAEQVVAEMTTSGTACSLVILDACRATPVARDPAHRDAASAGGLVEMNAPAGSLIAFATDAGRVASDGEGGNGLYTSELLKHLSTPGITIEQVFKRTRSGVIERSGGTQVPAEYSRLIGNDIFLAGPAPGMEQEDPVPRARPVPLPSVAEVRKLAAAGNAAQCIHELRKHARARSGLNAAGPLGTLLDFVKERLRNPAVATPIAESLLQSCDLVLEAADELLSEDQTQRSLLSAKAHNRRGDALLLLGKAEQALEAFNTALALTPDDAYVLYNRGMALLRLERRDEAREAFENVSATSTKQPGAKKLATAALAQMRAERPTASTEATE